MNNISIPNKALPSETLDVLVFSAFLTRAINTPPANKVDVAFCESNLPTQKDAIAQGGMEEVKTVIREPFSSTH